MRSTEPKHAGLVQTIRVVPAIGRERSVEEITSHNLEVRYAEK